MRDRRNTSLSVSSNSSTNSTRPSLNEKRHFSPPPPSPTLPSPVTKENNSKPNARPRLRMAARLFAVTCTVVVLWHLLFRPITPYFVRLPGSYRLNANDDLSGGESLPGEPTALIVSDAGGYSRWTVSIPDNYTFPLRSQQYQNICKQGSELRESIAKDSRLVRAKDWQRKHSYYATDHTFLEVDKAESNGALPRPRTKSSGNVCAKSLTFALTSEDSSFGKSLLMLWLSYGLAKREGRAFFIDDSRWAYGRYSSFFAPPLQPECVQPSPQHIVPCPHSAKHIVASSATLPWTFGSSFEKEFLQLRKHGSDKNRRIYDLLRLGYQDLFVMRGEDALYASSRLARFKEEAHQHSGSVVGIHIRRGDLHPLEYQYSQDYLPLERYASAARKMLRTQLRASLPETHTDVDDFSTILEYVHSPLLLGSDDPEMFDSVELKEYSSPFKIQKAQERIQLATKAKLDRISPAESLREPGSAYIKHVEENSGWEGGFYSSLFFALGKARPGSGSLTVDGDAEVLPEPALQMRELVGRAYLLDLAILGESDGVVCAVSSASCRLLGVMLGWDAIKDGRWMNVDDGRPWSWDGRS